eukprot:TRINITY_DN38827_c0_g1_i1.p1 TRINITY_DN38827_c0_g1~~TRINITY_DN38827_c0_g1_i1.p1  ORF type:complete len:185 (+),score=37.47 TRINITY_DN38827_c0_g1_i1:56-610(+)
MAHLAFPSSPSWQILGRPPSFNALSALQHERRIVKEEKIALRAPPPAKICSAPPAPRYALPRRERSSPDLGASGHKGGLRKVIEQLPEELQAIAAFDLPAKNLVQLRAAASKRPGARGGAAGEVVPTLTFQPKRIHAMWVPGSQHYTDPVVHFHFKDASQRPKELRKTIPGCVAHTGESKLIGF